MRIHPNRNDRDHARALRHMETLWGARARTPAAEALEILVTLVDAYEAKRHRIPPRPDRSVKFRMDKEGLTRVDLEKLIGSRSRVSEVLNRRRSLTVAMTPRRPGHLRRRLDRSRVEGRVRYKAEIRAA